MKSSFLAGAVRFLATVMLCFGATAARAQAPAPLPANPAALVAQLAEADFDTRGRIADALAASGFARAGIIIDALAMGTLYAAAGGRVVIESGDGTNVFSDALTGTPVRGLTEDRANKIGINNRLRRDLRSLSARLSLMSPDRAIREHAAADAFAAHDPDSLPAIVEAIAKETDPAIRNALEQARAATVLGDAAAPEADKLAAIPALRNRGDADALNILLASEASDSLPVRGAAAAAVTSIQNSLAWWGTLQNVYYGVSLGSVLLLAAAGLAITFGVMGVINMAHGEMMMLGAYTTYSVQQLLIGFAPGLILWSLPIAIPAAFLVSGSMGIVIERTIIRFLYGRPLETLLATWGVSLILQQGVRTLFGASNKPVSAPEWMTGSFDLGHIAITYSRLWIIAFAIAVLAALMGFLRHTQFGMRIRAVTQNRRMAASMGVRTNWVDALTFGLGSGVAGIAGVALSQIDNVSPNLGQGYIIDSFMVVVFGGVGNLWGTLVGSMALGIANKLLEPLAGAVMGKILALAFIILFIQRRPKGLFALRGRAVEA